MILGVIIGVYAPNVQNVFNGAKFAGTSVRKYRGISLQELGLRAIALVIGMIVMMWPALTKVEYERLPALLRTKRLYYQIFISLILNWIIGPIVCLFPLGTQS
jgi:ACR3 family arsenite transporter